jgi:hypothetical protein
MLEGIPNTVYGRDAAHANRLMTVGGAVSVAAAAETTLTVGSAREFAYLTYLRCDCTVASTTAGVWTLRLALAGGIALLLQQPVTAAVVGSSYCWPFPVPWKTTAQAGVFTITPSVATMGTWLFICNGFHSSI